MQRSTASRSIDGKEHPTQSDHEAESHLKMCKMWWARSLVPLVSQARSPDSSETAAFSHLSPRIESSQTNSVTLPAGSALLNTGQGQDLVGRSPFASLQQILWNQGLKAVVLPHATRTAKCTGGQSTVNCPSTFATVHRRGPKNHRGHVIDEAVLHILSVGPLPVLGTVLDLSINLAVWTKVQWNTTRAKTITVVHVNKCKTFCK